MTNRIFGGASFPARMGTLSMTWPLAVLTVSESGVCVDLRSRLLKRTLGWLVDRGASSVWWMAEWTDLASVDFGRRSVVLRGKGHRSCRFVTMARRRLLPLIDELERRDILVNRVTTTIGWFVNPT